LRFLLCVPALTLNPNSLSPPFSVPPSFPRSDYPEFEKWMGPLMELSDGNLNRLCMERIPPSELAEMRANMGIALPSSTASKPPAHSGAASTGTAHRPVGAGAGPAPAAARSAASNDDARSVATAAMDLDPIAQKMRRVLGKTWMNVARDIERKAEREAVRAGSAAPSKTGVVSASLVRDALAEKGVPLTSKEVRAISLKYHGGGVPSTRTVDGSVDVSRVMSDVFGASGARRPHTAAAAMRSH
jgi:hypothetical protein